MKSKIVRAISFLGYWLGFDALFYWLNRKSKRIITLHNVLPDEMCQAVASVGVSTSLGAFSRTINELSRKYKFSADIDDVRTMTITFDDGTLNEYEIAGRELIRRGIPAILFVTGDMIGAGGVTMPIIEQVCVWSQFVPEDVARDAFGEFANRVELWQKYVQPGFRRDAANRGRVFLKQLNDIYSIQKILDSLPKEWNRLRMSGVSKADLNDLRAHGWLIGWHTKSHFPLGCLSLQERRDELDCPPEMRNVVLGYPYGDEISVGKETPSIAKELGYPAALSNTCNYSPLRGRYFMSRFAISDNKYDIHFQLSGLKYFIQCRKLLPKV